MKRFTAFAAICGFGSVASAWGIYISATAMNSAAALATETAAAADSAAAPVGLCISNFSKNDCDGVVQPGHLESVGCDDQGCRVIRVTDAVYEASLKNSGLFCGQACEGRCDEFPDATLTLKFDYVVRTDSCCPYRGSWDGEWELVSADGRHYAGVAHGTIGVGTNRESDCNVTHDACEPCADVFLDGRDWLIGIEGSFRGQASPGPRYPDELNFTCDGTWIVSAISITPEGPFGEPFKVKNRFDGAFLDYCP